MNRSQIILVVGALVIATAGAITGVYISDGTNKIVGEYLYLKATSAKASDDPCNNECCVQKEWGEDCDSDCWDRCEKRLLDKAKQRWHQQIFGDDNTPREKEGNK